MKKQLCAAMMITAFSMPTLADSLGVYAGVDYRTTETSYTNGTDSFDDTNNLSGYVAFEHFIPLIPNVKLKYSDLSSEYKNTSGDLSSSALNGILYYGLLDNDLIDLDLGVAYTDIEGLNNQNTNLGQAYGAVKLHIPGTGMQAFGEVIGGSITDDKALDGEVGLAYTFNPDSALLNVSVRAGYRAQKFEINKFTQENKGLFAGLELHF